MTLMVYLLDFVFGSYLLISLLVEAVLDEELYLCLVLLLVWLLVGSWLRVIDHDRGFGARVELGE